MNGSAHLDTIRQKLSHTRISEKIQNFIPTADITHRQWMLHLSQQAAEVWEQDFLSDLDSQAKLIHCGRDFYELSASKALHHKKLLDTGLTRWICPLEHRWPANPNSQNFAERAAQGLFKKFGSLASSFVVFSPSPELKRVAANIKVRLTQLSADQTKSVPEIQLPTATLNTMIHHKGVLAGIAKNRIETGSIFDAGLGFLNSINGERQVSRAAGKILEVLELLKEAQIDCSELSDWLELGAAPGGMTRTLLQAGARVTAVDLAEMSPSLLKHPGLRHLKVHSDEIETASLYSAILSDMNGPTELAISAVARLIETLHSGALIVHTLKVKQFRELKPALTLATEKFTMSGAKLILVRHLFHNRRELTMIAVKQ